jgi:hypothetical protein
MITCKDAVRLMSEAMDRRLSWRQRFCLRVHLLMCSVCPRVRAQLGLIREALRRYAADLLSDASGEGLNHEVRARIRRALADPRNS